MVFSSALAADRRGLLSSTDEWLADLLGGAPADPERFLRALTHGSHGGDTYERLEFLGDRVLGLVIANWLYERHPDDPEGKLSPRLNMLVARITCASVGRTIGLVPHIRLGKQARDDGAFDSDNVIGDVVEALIGAVFLEQGLPAADAFIRQLWGPLIEAQNGAALHPKSALQEWAAAHNRKPPVYTLIERSGPEHSPLFTISVSLGSAGEARAEGRSKQVAESAAAQALLERLPK
jgi:ribonuclease III